MRFAAVVALEVDSVFICGFFFLSDKIKQLFHAGGCGGKIRGEGLKADRGHIGGLGFEILYFGGVKLEVVHVTSSYSRVFRAHRRGREAP